MATQLIAVNKENSLLEIDQLLVCTTESIPAISVLQELGLHSCERLIQRQSQGTASTIFFFENIYLELLWLEDEDAARQYAARTGIDFYARTRWQRTGASPFGVGLRYQLNRENGEKTTISSNEWVLSSASINLSAKNIANIEEPICFTVPEQLTLTTWLNRSSEAHQQLLSHPLGVKKLTDIRITINSTKELTNAMALLQRNGIIAIERGASPLLELTFDDAINRKVADARPILPIVLKY